MDKKISRLRRAIPTRKKISELRFNRLQVFRLNQAQSSVSMLSNMA